MISDFLKLKGHIEKGMAGKQPSFPILQRKMASYISVTNYMYLLFGGLPGSGKTAIVDSMFLLEPYLYWKENKEKCNINPFWMYRSMERAKYLKIAKWTSYLIFRQHGIRIDVPTMMCWSNKMFDLTDEHKKIIDSYEPFWEEFQDHCHIIDGAENPTGVWKDAKRVADKRGRWNQVDEFNREYVANDPKEMVLHVTDHVGKSKKERGFSDKQTLDKHSEYMGELRDKLGWTIIDIMQLNRNIEDTFRQAKTQLDVKPSDFKGSSNLYENADLVFGLMNPWKLQTYDYMGYDIRKFVNTKGYNRFRGLKILKNSYGIDDVRIGYCFVGENGYMKELPKSSDMNDEIYKQAREVNFSI